MNETEEQIRQTLDRLENRQQELAAEYHMVTEAIGALERLLGMKPSSESVARVLSGDYSLASGGPPTSSATARVPKFDAAAFFGLNQRDAVVKILKAAGKPLSMLQILEVLREANYPFKAKAPYQSLYPLMKKDTEIVKHGNLWGLKKTANPSGTLVNGSGSKASDQPDSADDQN